MLERWWLGVTSRRYALYSEIILIELISRHHDNLLTGNFDIEKIRNLVIQKYYYSTFCHNVEAYIIGYNVCLALKIAWHKPYSDFQLLPVTMHWWKNLSIDFIMGLIVSTNSKSDINNPILVIVDRLMKMLYYEAI